MADRNMDERWAMDLMGHKTRSCSERYNIVNMETRRKAAAMLEQPAPQAHPQTQGEAQPQQQPEGQGQDGHTSGIADMPKALAAGSQVQ